MEITNVIKGKPLTAFWEFQLCSTVGGVKVEFSLLVIITSNDPLFPEALRSKL